MPPDSAARDFLLSVYPGSAVELMRTSVPAAVLELEGAIMALDGTPRIGGVGVTRGCGLIQHTDGRSATLFDISWVLLGSRRGREISMTLSEVVASSRPLKWS